MNVKNNTDILIDQIKKSISDLEFIYESNITLEMIEYQIKHNFEIDETFLNRVKGAIEVNKIIHNHIINISQLIKNYSNQ